MCSQSSFSVMLLTDKTRSSGGFYHRQLFVIDDEFYRVPIRLSTTNCGKRCCKREKLVNFPYLKRENDSITLSDRQRFIFENRKLVCQSSRGSRNLVDDRKSSTRKTHRQYLMPFVNSLNMSTLKVHH